MRQLVFHGPRRLGHENVCERRSIYGCVPELRGSYADEVVVRAPNVVPFDGPAPLEWGALAEPLSVGTRAAAVGNVSPGLDELVIERRVGFDELPAVFEDYAERRLDAVKTLLQPTL